MEKLMRIITPAFVWSVLWVIALQFWGILITNGIMIYLKSHYTMTEIFTHNVNDLLLIFFCGVLQCYYIPRIYRYYKNRNLDKGN
jgi:hypothetical protein